MEIKKKGFTLAEVLITIGIIGVVAALTIPTLVNNYQTRSWNISSSNFEAKFGEALKIMNTQQSLSHLGTTERFVNELQKHMKVAKVCDNSELNLCFSDIDSQFSLFDVASKQEETYHSKPIVAKDVTTSASLGREDWNTNTMGVLFANGVSAIIAYNPKCNANPFDVNAVGVSGEKDSIKFDTDCVAMMYDVNAFSSPNIMGDDIRVSSYANLESNCLFLIDGVCVNNFVLPSRSYTKAECEVLKEAGKVPSCQYENDYWAAAVDICGGTDKMVNRAQLKQLAVYLYGTEEISDNGSTCQGVRPECNGKAVSINPDYVSNLKLPSKRFYIFSGNSHISTSAYFRLFTDNETQTGPGSRTVSMYAMCVGD